MPSKPARKDRCYKAIHSASRVRSRKKPPKNVAIKDHEFKAFNVQLNVGKYADIIPTLATVQFYQTQRVSETTALHWEDLLSYLVHGFEMLTYVSGIKCYLCVEMLTKRNGGERGIRTPGGVTPTLVFKTSAFNRSAISP